MMFLFRNIENHSPNNHNIDNVRQLHILESFLFVVSEKRQNVKDVN